MSISTYIHAVYVVKRKSLSFVASTSYVSKAHGVISCNVKWGGGNKLNNSHEWHGIQAVCMYLYGCT